MLARAELSVATASSAETTSPPEGSPLPTGRDRRSSDLRVRHLLQQLVNIQDEERRRIARDLHDLLGQRVTALRLRIELLRHVNEAADWQRDIADLLRLIDGIDQDLDFVACELRSTALGELGLATALRLLTLEWSDIYKVTVRFHANGPDRRLLPEVENCLYRIAQEALNNVFKHARATRASVLLEHRDDRVVLIIEDNGRGFDHRECARRDHRDRGMGLVGMRERAALVNGTFELESKPGRGTCVFVGVPAAFADTRPHGDRHDQVPGAAG